MVALGTPTPGSSGAKVGGGSSLVVVGVGSPLRRSARGTAPAAAFDSGVAGAGGVARLCTPLTVHTTVGYVVHIVKAANASTRKESRNMTLTPAYGRDYKSKKEVIAAWDSNQDFLVNDVSSPWNGSYINKADAKRASLREVNFRYKRLTMVFVHRV